MGREARRPEALRTAKAAFSDLVVVCAKCAKRQGLAKREAGRTFKRAMRQANPDRKTKVVVSGCLGPCPKRHIAVATPGSLAARRILLVDPASPADLAALLPDPSGRA